jgi:hypothetical protein
VVVTAADGTGQLGYWWQAAGSASWLQQVVA